MSYTIKITTVPNLPPWEQIEIIAEDGRRFRGQRQPSGDILVADELPNFYEHSPVFRVSQCPPLCEIDTKSGRVRRIEMFEPERFFTDGGGI